MTGKSKTGLTRTALVWGSAAGAPLAVGALMVAFANDLVTRDGAGERASEQRHMSARIVAAAGALEAGLTDQTLAAVETAFAPNIKALSQEVERLSDLVAASEARVVEAEAMLAARLEGLGAAEEQALGLAEKVAAQLAVLPPITPESRAIAEAGQSYDAGLYQALAESGLKWGGDAAAKVEPEPELVVYDDGDPVYDIKDSDREFLTDYGDYLAAECMSCHKIDWEYSGIPFIFKLEEDYFIHQMRAYQTGAKDNAAMASVARSLDDEMIQALAVYLKQQDPDNK